MNRACPKCGEYGDVFINHDNFMAIECLPCRFAWKEYQDGSWEWIVRQDGRTLEVETSGAVILLGDERLED